MKYLLITGIAFLSESIDSSLGMGYGTLLTPILILMGYEPLEIVPLILFSEFITGLLAATMHHKKGNVNFQKDSIEFKTAAILTACSILGTVAASYLAITLNKEIVKLYIAILLIVIGFTSFIGFKKKHNFSWNKVLGLGLLASFNKGISGGAYGPLVTGGQILSGIRSKSAVGITSLSEGLTCLVGVISYICLNGFNFNYHLGLALLIGALLSIPVSVNLVALIRENILKIILSIAIISLGFFNIFSIVDPLTILTKYPFIIPFFLLITSLILIKLYREAKSAIDKGNIYGDIRKIE
ncbi:MAG: sulfite exporter TauE/SafE family protein [Halanaerobiales bacterium]